MVSILLPSRQRAVLAQRSIESLGEGVEVLLWVDDDDPELEDYMKLTGCKVYVRPRVGYKNFHIMINYLAERAKGEWLMLFNDDALMHTPNWTELLPTTTHKPRVLNIFNSNPEVNLFPLMNRAMYECMGHYSLSAHCDSWAQDVANPLGIHEFVDGIYIEHIRDQLNDETKQHSQAAYGETSPLHSSDDMLKLIDEDIRKLKEIL